VVLREVSNSRKRDGRQQVFFRQEEEELREFYPNTPNIFTMRDSLFPTQRDPNLEELRRITRARNNFVITFPRRFFVAQARPRGYKCSWNIERMRRDFLTISVYDKTDPHEFTRFVSGRDTPFIPMRNARPTMKYRQRGVVGVRELIVYRKIEEIREGLVFRQNLGTIISNLEFELGLMSDWLDGELVLERRERELQLQVTIVGEITFGNRDIDPLRPTSLTEWNALELYAFRSRIRRVRGRLDANRLITDVLGELQEFNQRLLSGRGGSDPVFTGYGLFLKAYYFS